MQKVAIITLSLVLSSITAFEWWSVYQISSGVDARSSVHKCDGSGLCKERFVTYNNQGYLVEKEEVVWVGKF